MEKKHCFGFQAQYPHFDCLGFIFSFKALQSWKFIFISISIIFILSTGQTSAGMEI